MDDKVMIVVAHVAKDIVLAAIGAAVFIFGLIHSVPLSTQAVEYVGTYGAYFGIHVYSSAAIGKAGVQATTTKPQ